MALDEVMFGYTRSQLLEKYIEHVSSISAVHRVMNDPLVRVYRDSLRDRKEAVAAAKRADTDKLIQDALPDVAKEMISLATKADSESVRARAGRDVLWIGGMKPTTETGVSNEIPHLAVYDNRAKKQANDEDE